MKKLFTREEVVMIINEILQYPEEVIDAVTNGNTQYGAQKLFDMVEGGLFDLKMEQ